MATLEGAPLKLCLGGAPSRVVVSLVFRFPRDAGVLIVGAGGYFWPAAYRNFLIFVLQLVKVLIDAALPKQLLVSSFLAHQSFLHYDDLVTSLHRRKPMS